MSTLNRSFRVTYHVSGTRSQPGLVSGAEFVLDAAAVSTSRPSPLSDLTPCPSPQLRRGGEVAQGRGSDLAWSNRRSDEATYLVLIAPQLTIFQVVSGLLRTAGCPSRVSHISRN